MNIGLIIAGGKGQRMLQEIPKQFLNVNDKPEGSIKILSGLYSA